jgi:hypothetical protein
VAVQQLIKGHQMKVSLLLSSFLFTSVAFAGADIGYGDVVSIKNYDFNNAKLVKIHLKNATYKNTNCDEGDNTLGTLTFSQHDEAFVNRTLSIAMAAYMGGKKVRLYSDNGTCEIHFIALQEQKM